MQPHLKKCCYFIGSSQFSEVGCAIIVSSFEWEIEAQRGEATCQSHTAALTSEPACSLNHSLDFPFHANIICLDWGQQGHPDDPLAPELSHFRP